MSAKPAVRKSASRTSSAKGRARKASPRAGKAAKGRAATPARAKASRVQGRGKAAAGKRVPAKAPAGRAPPTKYRSDLTEGLAYVDGKVLPAKDARIPLQDRGFLLGDGIFETMRTTRGEVFRLEDHAARVRKGLAAINLDEAIVDEFHDAVHELVSRGRRTLGDEMYLRIMITTGPMEDVAGTGRGLTVAGLCRKFKPYPMSFYANGIHAVLSKQRKDPTNPLSSIKTLSFLPYVAARREAHSSAVHDAILLNLDGRVAEASTSNVFAVRDNIVYAPGAEEGAVAGVTRGVVLEILQDAGIEVRPQLGLATLRGADEAWLTNTTGGVIPLTRFEDKPIGTGRKGELTAQVSHGLEAILRNHA